MKRSINHLNGPKILYNDDIFWELYKIGIIFDQLFEQRFSKREIFKIDLLDTLIPSSNELLVVQCKVMRSNFWGLISLRGTLRGHQ